MADEGQGGGEGGGSGDEGGGGGGSWTEALSEELRGNAELTKYENVDALARSHLSAQRMVSQSVRIPGQDAGDEAHAEFRARLNGAVPGLVAIPGEGATEEEMSSYWAALGRPEAPTAYELKPPELPEGIEYDNTLELEFRDVVHKAGLSGAQAKAIFDWYGSHTAEHARQAHEAMRTAETTMRQQWGDQYDTRLGLARKAGAQFFGDEGWAVLEESGAGNHPAILQGLMKVAELGLEDPLLRDLASAGGGGVTPDEIRDKIAELRANEAYTQRAHPQHASITERINGLYEQLEKVRRATGG